MAIKRYYAYHSQRHTKLSAKEAGNKFQCAAACCGMLQLLVPTAAKRSILLTKHSEICTQWVWPRAEAGTGVGMGMVPGTDTVLRQALHSTGPTNGSRLGKFSDGGGSTS